MIKLLKIEMPKELATPGEMYIWVLPHGDKRIVTVNDLGDGLDEAADKWWFDDNLVGELYGPFELNKQTGGGA